MQLEMHHKHQSQLPRSPGEGWDFNAVFHFFSSFLYIYYLPYIVENNQILNTFYTQLWPFFSKVYVSLKPTQQTNTSF